MHAPLNTLSIERERNLAHCVKYNEKLSVELYSSSEIVCIGSLVRKRLS